MNAILKNVLLVAEQVAVKAVPGASLVDAGIHAVVDHKDRASTSEGIGELAEGAITAIEAIKGVDIADEQMFRAGLMLMQQGESLIKRSLIRAAPMPA